ncbi:uncharacterized protein DS421_4g123690 [Arachis hypogaea]|nr:uncharacterized protein DS421_4g123690 [Arachis hypogaea]
MARGKIMYFHLERVREIFKLPLQKNDHESYNRRVVANQKLDQALKDICLPKTQWIENTKGEPCQLKRANLKPVAKGWLNFIGHSILPTSNRSEVNIPRAVMIHYIMMGNEVEVHQIISREIYKLVNRVSTNAMLAYPNLIFRLCQEAKVMIPSKIFIPVVNHITKQVMESSKIEEDQLKRKAPEPP